MVAVQKFNQVNSQIARGALLKHRSRFICIILLMVCDYTRANSQVSRKPSVTPDAAKCSYLKRAAVRVAALGTTYADSIAGDSSNATSSGPDGVFDSTAATARVEQIEARAEQLAALSTVAESKLSACRAAVSLSSGGRLSEIERLRSLHVKEATNRWERRTGVSGANLPDALLGAINSIYDVEARSIANSRVDNGSDPDIAKEFPALESLIAESALDSETKTAIRSRLGMLRFAEAGRLYEILAGIDSTAGMGPAYQLRVALEARSKQHDDSTIAALAAAAASLEQANLNDKAELRAMVIKYALLGVGALVILVPAWMFMSRWLVRVGAIRAGAKRAPYWGGSAEFVLWDPGETVVLLRNKRLLAMEVDAQQGGITSISAWKGEEYKGRISSKTQLFAWKSEAILTADGLPIRFHLGIWWSVETPSRYVSRIAAEYHDDGKHRQDSLMGAAEVWLEKLAAGTLRQQVSLLPSARIISPRAESFLEVRQGANADELSFSREISNTLSLLNEKTSAYGIHVERIEVQELELPQEFQKTIEEMRRAHIEPGMAGLESQAYSIRENAKIDAETRRIAALADVIGRDAVAAKEVLKEVNLSAIANPLIAISPVVQPLADLAKGALSKGLGSAPSEEKQEAVRERTLPSQSTVSGAPTTLDASDSSGPS